MDKIIGKIPPGVYAVRPGTHSIGIATVGYLQYKLIVVAIKAAFP